MPISEFDGGNDPYPVGAIIPWVGDPKDLPYGWSYCDGTGGTPDLRDKFIKSVSSNTTDPGATGGQHSFTMSNGQLPSHSHSGSTSYQDDHSHNISEYKYADIYYYGDSTAGGTLDNHLATSTEDGGHDHNESSETSAGSNNTINNRPLFFEVGFIQKQQIQ